MSKSKDRLRKVASGTTESGKPIELRAGRGLLSDEPIWRLLVNGKQITADFYKREAAYAAFDAYRAH